MQMKQTIPKTVTRKWVFLTVWLLFPVLACTAKQQGPLRLTRELPFDRAVRTAVDGLVDQTKTLPPLLAKWESKFGKRVVVIDPMMDEKSVQQNALTKRVETTVLDYLNSTYDQFEVRSFRAEGLTEAQYLLTGTTANVAPEGSTPSWRINLAMTDIKTGRVVAQASVRAQDEGDDTTPTPFYRDSPVIMKDAVVSGYVRTSATAPGQLADKTYLDHLTGTAQVEQATQLYNKERYEEALHDYKMALANTAGEQMRAHGGVYLSSAKLGIKPDAEAAFLKLVTMGIAAETLSVKFLFKPGGTDFWPDPQNNGPYPLWLRQIAVGVASAKICMEVIGHTSRTGTAEFNNKLSLQRASYIKQRLEAEAFELTDRLKALGKGFSENIIGTGTDDASDALDRRVEFKIARCA
jgi:hypothetical protein